MDELLLSLLLMMGKLEGITDVPKEVPSSWVTENKWHKTPQGEIYTASSTQIVETCKSQPSGYIRFPVVLYGAHEILLDDSKRIQFGDPTMQTPNYVVSAPVLPCHSLLNVTQLRWTTTAYSKYFARVPYLPEFVKDKPYTELFGQTLYIGGSIGLLVLFIFALSVMWRKESTQLIVGLSSSIIGMAIYEISLIAPAFEINLPMLTVHRIGDLACIYGSFFIVYCFKFEDLIPRRLFQIHSAFVICSIPFFLLAKTGNTIQFGTTLPFTTMLISFAWAACRLAKEMIKSQSIGAGFQFLYALIFFFVVAADVNVFTGSSSGYTYVSIGILLAFLVGVLSMNQRITATYRERDYLRSNLEKEVERKTYELKTKSDQLEATMRNLRHTQAELIHSAKLASLGTLSAGVAHEINNSVNFVSGAIAPLEKLIGKLEPVSPKDYEMGRKLIAAIRDGINITTEIVRSLRQFTGLNQAKLKDVQLTEVLRSVTTILRPRLKENYTVEIQVPESMVIYGDVVGINQILMNLITNAIDAMPSGGTIRISAEETEDATVLKVSDTGSGIPDEIQSRIFDPFFTTKEVGSGTGLGLYIISKEMDRHKGKITVGSEIGKGTHFALTFPKKNFHSEAAA